MGLPNSQRAARLLRRFRDGDSLFATNTASLSRLGFPVPEMRVACRLAPPPSRPDCPPLLLTAASNRHAGLSGGLQPIINIVVVVEREDLVTVKVRAEAHKFVSAGRSLHPLRVRNAGRRPPRR